MFSARLRNNLYCRLCTINYVVHPLSRCDSKVMGQRLFCGQTQTHFYTEAMADVASVSQTLEMRLTTEMKTSAQEPRDMIHCGKCFLEY